MRFTEAQLDYVDSQVKNSNRLRTRLKYALAVASIGLAVAGFKTGALPSGDSKISFSYDTSHRDTDDGDAHVVDPNIEPPVLANQPRTTLYDGPFENPKDLRKIGTAMGTFSIICAYFEPGERPEGISVQTSDGLEDQTPTWLLISNLDENLVSNQGYIRVKDTMQLHGWLLQCAADVD